MIASAKAISALSPGSVTAKNSRTVPAPSTRAASYSERSIDCTPAMNSTTQRPIMIQAPTSPIAMSARSGSPSQPASGARPPRPTARSPSEIGPSSR